MIRRALITGITGQDGSYLAELLLSKGYEVYGLVRRTSAPTNKYTRINHILNDIQLVDGDITDSSSLEQAIIRIMPHEIYNLAAQSYVGTSWKQPALTCNINALGTIRLLECIRHVCPYTRFYQASSSELFGKTAITKQDETTPFYPRSPYGYSKLMAYWAVVNHRESYGLHASNGILFNHESPRRGAEFVTRKISLGVANIYHGSQEKIKLGNLDARRDWGFAGDYVHAMWLMLQEDEPDDFVVATGEHHTVREFCKEAFANIGISDWENYVEVDQNHVRPADVEYLCGDATKAHNILGWRPQTTFKELVEMMVLSDINSQGYLLI